MSKYFTSEKLTVMRSEIHFADYNPRKIDDEGRRALKRSIKRYGVVDGIVINKQTNNTIVGGHQKVAILDELQKYDEETKANDYELSVSVVDLDPKAEKELNITLNNPNVGGYWDQEKLRMLIPDIDFKETGLTEADLSLIGVDYLFKTKEEFDIAGDFADVMEEANQEHQMEVERRREQREAIKDAQMAATAGQMSQAEADERRAHMMDVKEDVKHKASKDAEDMDAYVVLSFSSYEGKKEFLEMFGYSTEAKFIKGEDFVNKL